jgi:hypothetical protein
MKLTVKQLKEDLVGVPDDALVVFQGNVPGEEDGPSDEPGYTICTGHLYSAFARPEAFEKKTEFVLDCAITNSEGGILS